jgi:peptidoglycan/LPS O-acetylase OafA/YrhL
MRAIAVLAVLFFHAGLGVPGGFVGVDVFFVISGFLITMIVTREVKEETFTYLGFWERRARRLLPAMTVVVVATCLIGYVVLLPHDFKELGQSVIAQAIAAANFCFWRESGYFAGPSEIKPLLHTWSLAVEEQFYLVMPGMLVLLHRRMPKYTLHTLVTAMIASVGWCVYSTPVFPDAAFYLLPARSWELLLGGIVALTVDAILLRRAMAETLSFVGLCTVAASLFVFREGTPFPGSYAIFPCLGTAAMIIGNSGHVTLVSRLLAWRPLVFVGLISYSL